MNKAEIEQLVSRALRHGREQETWKLWHSIRVTELIRTTAWQRVLSVKDEVEEDVLDGLRNGALVGTAIHEYLSRIIAASNLNGQAYNLRSEERLVKDIPWNEGEWQPFFPKTLTGQPDLLIDDKILVDFKTIRGSQANFLAEKVQPGGEWWKQLNIYNWLLSEHVGCEQAFVVALPRDYNSIAESKRKQPNEPLVVLEVPLFGEEAIEELIKREIQRLFSEPLIDACEPHETWEGKRCEHYCKYRFVCPASPHTRIQLTEEELPY